MPGSTGTAERSPSARRSSPDGRAEGRHGGTAQIDAGGQGGRRGVHRAIAPADRGRGGRRRRSVPVTGRAGRSGADGCRNVAPGPLHNGAPVCYRVIVSPGAPMSRRSSPSDGGSSNGRTADSDSASLGSNPSPPATQFRFFINKLTLYSGPFILAILLHFR